jgi:hypothetical protein
VLNLMAGGEQMEALLEAHLMETGSTTSGARL